MNDRVWVHKQDEHGNRVWKYPARSIQLTPTHIRLEARFDRDDVAVGPLFLERDDIFIETFFFDRWYNIFEVFSRDGEQFKGWYCNIARPARMDGQHLYAEDLALDLVVMPDGRHAILDEGEFENLEIPEQDRAHALHALHDLQKQVTKRSGIFANLPEI